MNRKQIPCGLLFFTSLGGAGERLGESHKKLSSAISDQIEILNSPGFFQPLRKVVEIEKHTVRDLNRFRSLSRSPSALTPTGQERSTSEHRQRSHCYEV